MFLRIGTMKFPSQDKMDAYIAMLQTVFFKKFQELFQLTKNFPFLR